MDEDNNQADPSAAPAEANAETRNASIPKQRFDEVNDRRRTAETENERLRARIAELEQSKRPQPAPATPKPADPPSESQTPADVDRLRRLEMILETQASGEVVDAMMPYVKQGLTTKDAMTLVRQNQPQLFGKDTRGFDPNAHHASPPGGRAPQPPAEPSIGEKIAATRDPHRRQGMALKAAADLVTAQILGQLDKKK